ncbi:UDP-N-acetylglucosamine 2-epimerase (hydrolyzing) [Winogradskyella sp. F6397]|uniref:UDP-N-acetylglucosamine 2-epimerase (Hydrolyzing) n=1 Tax=Winogradskyella marina TaxID=2785530 RepID=A0ABS0EN00_9FLAO|nr:UDP-N-acetylglucosamine 2-epimerase [Winogradskyella marina]MBF8150987.1 UDP-N-acetylglucosamine 2-epimerase (hydrolyzing) [Winogradskyella marina]
MKQIVFLTGTRADFGKLKSLLAILQDSLDFEPHIFVTGMHLQHLYGYTLIEIKKSGFKNIYTFENHTDEATMDLTLAKTISGFSDYIKSIDPDLIVVHGDRVEALAGAIVGSLNNVLVAHIEGGEVSGTIDELLRHATSKMSHVHFVSNDQAKSRLIQMGELESAIYTIGSPDVDIMFSDTLPDLDTVKHYYDIPFERYNIVMFHPVTTEAKEMSCYAEAFVNALLASKDNYVVIYPNNDLGSQSILKAYTRLENNTRFKVFPSLRFEYFLTLLKHAQCIIGNSSAGVREAPYYGIPVINIGTRQQNRVTHSEIINVDYSEAAILEALHQIPKLTIEPMTPQFGGGDSGALFLKSLQEEAFWLLNHQKQFRDVL